MKHVILERKCLAEQNIRNADVERLARLNAETEAWQRRNGIRPQPFTDAQQARAQQDEPQGNALGMFFLLAVGSALFFWLPLAVLALADHRAFFVILGGIAAFVAGALIYRR